MNEVKKHIEEELDKSILEQLRESEPWANKIDLSPKPIPKDRDTFYKNIMEMAEKVQKAIDEQKAAEPDAILVDSEGRLVQLLGNATTHDWVVWYIKEFKNGKL